MERFGKHLRALLYVSLVAVVAYLGFVLWSGAGEALIKRVVALPGQTVAMQAGKVLVDGAPLSEPYASAATPAANLPPEFFEMAPRKMEPGEYWVLGDNRGNSDDSRFNGPLPGDAISGRVTRILLPWDRRKVVK